jgi:RNA polymerase sigma factor (sigma-70 family)
MDDFPRGRALLASRPAASPYELHRDYVLRVLGSRCSWLDPSDREALLHDAYAVFLEKLSSGQLDGSRMRPAQVRAYLTQTALNKAMDEGKRAGRRRSVSLDDEDLGIDPADPARDLDDRLATAFEDARVREIVAELPERQQLVIRLRFFYDRTPAEIQSYLGVTERVYRRELERASHRLAERFGLLRDGTFCDSRRSLLLAYATGVAGPTRTMEARRHLDTCPGCAHWVRDFRARTYQAAAVVPVPAAVPAAHALNLTLLGHHIHARLVHLAASARAHATRVLIRPDPTPMAMLGGARPGAVAVIVSGCLAAGSGATYCVVQGLPAPLRSLVAPAVAKHGRQHRQHRQHLLRLSQLKGHAAVVTAPPASPPVTRPVIPLTSQTKPAPVSQANGTASRVHKPAAHGSTRRSRAPHPAHRPAARPVVSHRAAVNNATAAEFGVGNGTPAGPPPAATHAAVHVSAPTAQRTVKADTASTHRLAGSAAGTDKRRAAVPRAANGPLPEFDP